MTQQTPPPMSYQQPQFTMPSSTNPLAIVSLVCGIIGCLGITALAAVITGIIALVTIKPPQKGKGMATAGIVLALLWVVVGIAAAVGSAFLVTKGIEYAQTEVAKATKTPAIHAINSLSEGNLAPIKALGLTDAQASQIGEQIKGLGQIKDITVASPSFNNNNGVITYGFTGTALFENGTKTLDVQARMLNGKIVFDTLDLK
jgi:hypothetical protein